MTTSKNETRAKLLVSDRVIHNLSEFLLECAEAMHKNHDLVVWTNTEGPCLESLTYKFRDNLINLLSEMCVKMDYDPKRITIETGNLIESLDKFNVVIQNTAGGWFYGSHLSRIKQDLTKDFKYHFGNFVSNSTYPRLLLASHLHQHHGSKTLQTYRRDPMDPGHAVELDLDKLMFETCDPTVLIDVTKFIQHLPMEREKDLAEHPKTNLSAGEDGDAINHTILSWYKDFFCDVVTETMYSGKCFFLTEKTTRPLLCMNPFITHGPVNFLKNLKALGFKTFSKYWSEDYDYLSGYARCKEMYNLIGKIAQMDSKKINMMYSDMIPLLKHNRDHLISMTDNKFEALMPNLA